MGRKPCCEKHGLKKGAWSPEEDQLLTSYITTHGHGKWRSLPKLAGLLRCGKSCRLRWANYLRPDIKRGPFTEEEQKQVVQLHGILVNRWAAIAAQLPGRTDNEIKNLWNTHLRKQFLSKGLDPQTHQPLPFITSNGQTLSKPATPSARHMAQWESARLEAEHRLSRSSSSLVLNTPQPLEKPKSDHFMRLWNSTVGDSFRKVGDNGSNSSSYNERPASEVAFRIKWEPNVDSAASSLTGNNLTENVETKSWKSYSEEVMADSVCSSFRDFDDSSDSALHFLLDFPVNNDMSFLEDHINGNMVKAFFDDQASAMRKVENWEDLYWYNRNE